jgi:23S rRNA (guanosine2251-2'-O)-methyltransferase
MSTKTYLFGKNPLQEALLFAKRHAVQPIQELFLTKASIADDAVMSLVQTHKIPYTVITSAEIESHTGHDAVHQGVLARLDEKTLYTSLDEVLAQVATIERPLFVLLDELQDPHNVGAIIRSAVAFGANAILMPEHNQTQITGTVIKSSAGTTFAIPIVRIGNTNSTLIRLKEKGFWVYALTGEGETSLTNVSFDSPSVIIIGSEGSGIAKKTLEHSDFKLSIPIAPLCESLNASNAVAVTLYEWSKQQRTQ